MSTVIQIENLWKEYQLGVIGHGTLTHDLQSWWARVRGKEDPNAKISPMLAGQEKQINGDRFWALRDINLEIKEGEILGIIGRNGAGKSTLLKILSRVTAPTNGNIKVKGRIASLLEVGTGFHPELTGRENIFMNGSILGMSKQEIKAKLDEIIDFSGVEQYLDTPVKRYSSGMRVRLGFSVAPHLEPEILVIDEVLAVGDAEFQRKCLGKMNKVARAGRTILFVSHNMVSVGNLCSRGILLENGKVRIDNPIDEVISEYLTQQYATFDSENILTRKDRNGTGELHITKVEFLNPTTKKPSGHILSGDEILISLTINAKKDISGVSVAVAFFNTSGNIMFSCLSNAVGKVYNFKSEEQAVLYCHINKWPTSGGRYTYNINARKSDGYLDFVKDAGFVDVESGDFYGTGVLPAPSKQTVLIDFNYD